MNDNAIGDLKALAADPFGQCQVDGPELCPLCRGVGRVHERRWIPIGDRAWLVEPSIESDCPECEGSGLEQEDTA